MRGSINIMDAYKFCLESLDGNSTDRQVIECTINANNEESFARSQGVTLVFAGFLVFVMQAGFAMICAGCVRQKNVQNTLLKNLLDVSSSSVTFFAIGYAFAFGSTDDGSNSKTFAFGSTDNYSNSKTFVGTSNFFLVGVDNLSFWFFQYVFSATAVTIIAGTLAERCQMLAYLYYSVFVSGWVYPVIVHSIWSRRGFLSPFAANPFLGVGMLDFAGSGVVHLTGGITALFAAIILGPRRGRFTDETGRTLEVPRDFIGSSFSLQMLGTLLVWFGCYGFNAGSAILTRSPMYHQILALCASNTSLAGGAGGISALLVNLWYLERFTGEAHFDIKKAMNGSLTGLISIAGSCGIVEPWAAVLIGTVSGVVYLVASSMLIRLRIDDACDAIPVHGFGGLWGVIAVGLFASPTRLLNYYNSADHPGLFYSWSMRDSDFRLLGAQVVGALFIIGWVLVLMLPFFVWLDWRGLLRSDPLEELVGLDTSYHGGLALISNNDSEVKAEHITEYRNRQIELSNLRRRSSASDTSNSRRRPSVHKQRKSMPTKPMYKPDEGDDDELEMDEGFDPKVPM